MIEYGKLKAGDRALEYGLLSQGERGLSDKGLKETLEQAGLKVDYIEISPEVNADSSLAVPILTAYLAKNPDVKALGTQHGGVTSQIGKALEQAGKKPGDVVVGGIDLAPATIDGLEKGWISVTLDQQLYLQGFLPVTAVRAVVEVRLHRREREHGCRRRHPADDRCAGAADREGDPLTPGTAARPAGLSRWDGPRETGLCGRSWRRAPASGRSRPLGNASVKAGPTSSLPGSRPRSSC